MKKGYTNKSSILFTTYEYEEDGTTLLENFYIIGDRLGIFGIYDKDWGLYILGPVFKPVHHTVENVVGIFEQITALEELEGKEVDVDVVEANDVMLKALPQAGFENSYKGVAMSYDLRKHEAKEIPYKIVEVTLDDREYLEEIHQIFLEGLDFWSRRKSLDDLVECLEDGSKIAILLEGEKVAGAGVWNFDGTLNEGEMEYLCVAKTSQGKGYGKSLLDYAANQLALNVTLPGEATWFLDTAQENVNAIEFYTHYGFAVDYYRSSFRRQL
ncbi:MAG: GNAT family N-acetyltransferase [Turicibacter sp.]|nr:GNAT family N-acetyltransferase [Turicibacter sp.]